MITKKKKIFRSKNLTEDLPKAVVDIAEKKRSNLFAWRGQFSPQLIEALIENYANEGEVLYDPFCGSGTLLVEAAYFNLEAYGTELNPAAYGLASIYKLANVEKNKLRNSLDFVENLILDYFPLVDLFNNYTGKNLSDLKQELVSLLVDNQGTVEGIIINALIIGLDFEKKILTYNKLHATWENLKLKILHLPYTNKKIDIFLGDARLSKIQDKTIDFVITSPPYINVFNYHQNYRKSVEAIGFDILEVAKSEIGSNRKFRSNRYFTVIQYALDIYQVFQDLKRICKPESKIIFIVGRESSVRKTSFSNSKLLTDVAKQAGFVLVGQQSRVFKNKFGQNIYEEILRFRIEEELEETSIERAREVAYQYLKAALEYAPIESVSDLKEAISKYKEIKPSKIYERN